MSNHNPKTRTPKENEAKEFQEEVIQIDRVTRVVKGGRRMRFRACVIIGNRKGKVGIGVGKANEVTVAIQKAIRDAKKNLIQVPIIRDTIPHDIYIKYKSAKVLLMPASLGTGIIAGGAVRKLIALSGIKNILSKSFGSTNPINNARAALYALKLLPQPQAKVTSNKTGTDLDQTQKKELPKIKTSEAKPLKIPTKNPSLVNKP